MNLPQLTIARSSTSTTELEFSKRNIKIEEILIETQDLFDLSVSFVGIDPGTTRLGLAAHFENELAIVLWEITQTREPTTNERILVFSEILDYFIASEKVQHITVEGASYGDRYRQVELQDIRAGTVCNYPKAEIVPPRSIRKVVFGSAKIKNPWENIPDNAAAALACALYPIMKERK